MLILRSNHTTEQNEKIIFHGIRMLNLSLNELKLVSKSKGIKGYKSMSKERLLNALSELVASKHNFDD